MLSLKEAQELHEIVGAAYESGDTSDLRRARELSSMVSSDIYTYEIVNGLLSPDELDAAHEHGDCPGCDYYEH